MAQKKNTRGSRVDADLARQFAKSLDAMGTKIYPMWAHEALILYWLNLSEEERAKLLARRTEWTVTRKVRRTS